MARIPEEVAPFDEASVFANGAHSAQLDVDFITRTAALAYRAGGNVKHYAWPSQFTVPMTVRSTWYALGTVAPYGTTGIPWQMTPGFSWLQAIVTVAALNPWGCVMRLRTDDLVDGVAETTGEPSAIKALTTFQRDMAFANWGSWHQPGYREATFHIGLTPTVPANGRVAVYLDIRCDGLMVAQTAYLMRATLIELPVADFGGR